MKISICICTFRRPALLDSLLNELEHLDRTGLFCELVIVDNDPDESAQAIIQHWKQHGSYPLTARHLPTPNIALARNAAIHAATGDWIAIIDDDETPEPDWLQQLVATQRAENADVVLGPVLPRYPEGTPSWLRNCGIFQPHNLPTGTLLQSRQAYSGNVLIRRELLLHVPGPFDPTFGVTGGSDTMLFWDLQQLGARLVWCAEAVVHEDVPDSRLTISWVLQRSFRGGQSFVRAEVARLRGMRRWTRTAELGVQALMRLPVALVLSLAALPVSRATALRWLRTAYAQMGKLTALMGYRYHEYATA